MKIVRGFFIIGGLLTFATSAALAQAPAAFPEFNYNYVEAYYVNTELDDSGIELAGSLALRRDIRVFVSYLDQGYDNDLSRETLQLGVTYHWPLTEKLDMLVEAALADTEIERGNRTVVNDDGFILGAKLRAWMRPDLELQGGLQLDDSAGSGTDTIAEIGAQYYLRSTLSLGARLRTDEEATALFLGARYFFR
jgi:hypothetical protein